MTIQDLKEQGLIIYEIITGSQAYGTSTPESDVDIKGIFILPVEYILTNRYIPQVADEKK